MSQEYLKITKPEVLAAVQSLYADELQPFGRVVLKRLRERAAAPPSAGTADPAAAPRVDPKRLRKTCESMACFAVSGADHQDYVVRLMGRRDCFIDVSSPVDVYPPELWTALAAYVDGPEGEALRLRGGRYECSRALADIALPCLRGRTLGQICHIVQLSISCKRLLGYAGNHLVPFRLSEDCAKEKLALKQEPTSCSVLPVATLEQVRDGVRRLLLDDPAPGGLPLTRVKWLFQCCFQLELSETALGHARLHRLLADAVFRDVCRLEDRGAGQIFLWPASPPSPPVQVAQPPPVAVSISVDAATHAVRPPPMAAGRAGEQLPQPGGLAGPTLSLPNGEGLPCAPMMPMVFMAVGPAPSAVPWVCQPHSDRVAPPLRSSSGIPQQHCSVGPCLACRPREGALHDQIVRRPSVQLLSPGASPVRGPARIFDFSMDTLLAERCRDDAVADDASTSASSSPAGTAVSTPVSCESAWAAESIPLFVKNTFIHVAEEEEEEEGASNDMHATLSLPHGFCFGRRKSDGADGAEHAPLLVRAARGRKCVTCKLGRPEAPGAAMFDGFDSEGRQTLEHNFVVTAEATW